MTDFKIGDRVRVKIDSKSWQNCRVIGESFGLVSVRDLGSGMRGSFFKAAIERLTDAADSKPVADGDRFQPGDVIRDENGKLWVIDESMDPYGRLVAGSSCRLEYRATLESLRLFSQPTSAMCIEQNRGFPVWLYAGPGLVMFADVDFVGECFRTRTLHPESALRWLKQKESDGRAVLRNHGNGPQLAQPDPSKRTEYEAGAALVKEIDAWSRHVNEFWAREEEKILKSVSIPALAGKPLRDLGHRLFGIGSADEETDAEFRARLAERLGHYDKAIMPSSAKVEFIAPNSDSPPGLAVVEREAARIFAGYPYKIHTEYPHGGSGCAQIEVELPGGKRVACGFELGIFEGPRAKVAIEDLESRWLSLREEHGASPHCAHCGDSFPLDASNQAVVVDPELGRCHAQCAAALAERRREREPEPPSYDGPDPYKRVAGKDICAEVDNVRGMTTMQIKCDRQRRAENAALFGRRVPERFTADVVKGAKAVVHPWECDEGEP